MILKIRSRSLLLRISITTVKLNMYFLILYFDQPGTQREARPSSTKEFKTNKTNENPLSIECKVYWYHGPTEELSFTINDEMIRVSGSVV